MDISVIGAGGAIGREIVAQIVASRVLRPTERLQIVGNATGASARSLYGFRSDLTDAYAESAPQIDIGLCPEDVVGDLIVFVAGVTLGEKPISRDSLALINRTIFEQYAQGISKHGHGHEIVLVVTNPVELGVSIFAEALGFKRVIGIGAYSDTLRFRREIAYDLGMPRQMVAGYVVGEHGDSMVPLWSSVRIYGFTLQETEAVVKGMQGTDPSISFSKRLNQMRRSLHSVMTEDTKGAFDEIDQLPPDIRVVLRPHITHHSGSRTVMATSNVTVDMARQIVGGQEMSVAGQVLLENSGFCGTKGVFGVPIILSSQGVIRVIEPPVNEIERKAILQASKKIQWKIAKWRSK